MTWRARVISARPSVKVCGPYSAAEATTTLGNANTEATCWNSAVPLSVVYEQEASGVYGMRFVVTLAGYYSVSVFDTGGIIIGQGRVGAGSLAPMAPEHLYIFEATALSLSAVNSRLTGICPGSAATGPQNVGAIDCALDGNHATGTIEFTVTMYSVENTLVTSGGLALVVSIGGRLRKRRLPRVSPNCRPNNCLLYVFSLVRVTIFLPRHGSHIWHPVLPAMKWVPYTLNPKP